MPCASANCGVRNWKWTYGTVLAGSYYSGGSWALVSDCNASGADYICSGSSSPPPGPVSGSCGGAFDAYHAWLCDSPSKVPGVDCQASGPHEITGTGLGCFDVACTCTDNGDDCECGDDPPDPDPGCCGADTCEENETCCNETTCVLTSTFQTDSNNCGGCGIVCPPGQTCVAGVCTGGGGDGCCYTAVCAYNSPSTPGEEYNYEIVSFTPSPTDCSTAVPNECAGVGYPPGQQGSYGEALCNESCVGGTIYIWSPEPCPIEAQASYEAQVWDPRPCSGSPTWWFLSTACPEGYTSSPPDGLPTNPPPCDPDYENGHVVESIVGCCEGIVQRPCTAVGGAMSYNPASQLAAEVEPCSQEECEAHVSTWMAEPSGEPNEKGLYKVNWVLLDGCPGACCSDQPTQPEFVKKSELIDAPCKCGCN